jgi:hypothetical protein
MASLDSYTVYKVETSGCYVPIVKNATFVEIEKYLDDNTHSLEGYSVVWNLNGMEL